MARTPRYAAAAIATALIATGCGSSPATPPPPWAATHPDPSSMHFADAQGLCAFAVRYPNEAPGEIDYQGIQYIQHGLTERRSATGQPVAQSGDWTVYHPSPDTLVVVTASRSFQYRAETKCGNNSAPPT